MRRRNYQRRKGKEEEQEKQDGKRWCETPKKYQARERGSEESSFTGRRLWDCSARPQLLPWLAGPLHIIASYHIHMT